MGEVASVVTIENYVALIMPILVLSLVSIFIQTKNWLVLNAVVLINDLLSIKSKRKEF